VALRGKKNHCEDAEDGRCVTFYHRRRDDTPHCLADDAQEDSGLEVAQQLSEIDPRVELRLVRGPLRFYGPDYSATGGGATGEPASGCAGERCLPPNLP
jgi:hypothetical protein